MSNYGLSTRIRAKVIFYTVLLSIVLTYILNVTLLSLSLMNLGIVDQLVKMIMPLFNGGVLSNSVSVGLIYGALSKVFNDYLWKFSLFKRLTNVCDLNGTWKGELESNFKDKFGNPVKVDMTLVIKQSWTEMTCKCYFPKSSSKSDLVWLKNEGKDNFSLQFSYSNQTREKEINTQPYNGFNILDYEKKDDLEYLNGIYFTDRYPQTRGNITLTKDKTVKSDAEESV
ncbi:hypothetical protein [uncultured Dialister sp.]|uniref:Cap15 family cyclic dinucleotide receptor domain-containing protein n=1 Tax=uncultured Dialister sp. TaxID=278064 RepID=UPI0025EEE161|nr:hypothetical protein [uncultured Dialister sp.]